MIEDCALTFDSSINNIKVGNFGDAAIFSTDHTKPINTLIGGFIYSKNIKLIKTLKNKQKNFPILNKEKQLALWKRFLFERKFCNPKHFGKLKILNSFSFYKNRIFNKVDPFLSDDYFSFQCNKYPYPCKMPTFLQALGIIELQRWPLIRTIRKKNYEKLIYLFNLYDLKINTNNSNINKEIIGLRLAGINILDFVNKKNFYNLFDHEAFWFKEPIISCMEDLDCYYYKKGMSKESERIGPITFNIHVI